MLNLTLLFVLGLNQPNEDMLGRPQDLIFSAVVTEVTTQQEVSALIHLKEMQYPDYDKLQRKIYSEIILERPSEAISHVVGYFVLPLRYNQPEAQRIFPVVGERRAGTLKLRFDGSVQFERVKRREDFIPHQDSITALWRGHTKKEPEINELEIKGIPAIQSIHSLRHEEKSDLKLEETKFTGTITLGGGQEVGSLSFWSIMGSPQTPRIGLYAFSPKSKLKAVISMGQDRPNLEKFLKTFSRLEKEFGIARLQENFYLDSANQSRNVQSKMESIIHQEFPKTLSIQNFSEMGIELFGSWKAILSIGCGLVKTSHLPLVAQGTSTPHEVFYGYSMNSTGRYVRYREISLKNHSRESGQASFNQTTWLMRSEAIEPFEMAQSN
jgi:hypothetical protein